MTISNEVTVVALQAWRATPFGGDALMNALEAAAPIIRAECLDEAAETVYVEGALVNAAWLRARAVEERGRQ